MSRERATAQQKQVVIRRARGCCEYCCSQLRFTNQSFSVEHIIPKSQGGQTTLDKQWPFGRTVHIQTLLKERGRVCCCCGHRAWQPECEVCGRMGRDVRLFNGWAAKGFVLK